MVAIYEWVYKDVKFRQVCGLRKYSDSSKKNIAQSLNTYCKYIHETFGVKMTPATLIDEADEEQNTVIGNRIKSLTNRKVSAYLAGFGEYLDNRQPPLSERMKGERYRAVRRFYVDCDIDVPNERKKKVNPKEENTIIPKLEDIRRAFTIANKSARNKAIMLAQCSSGMGSAEVLALKKDDFWKGYDPDTGVTTIRARRAKTNEYYYTFLNPEATEAVKTWLAVADSDDPRLFELEEFGLITMYGRINDGAGFNTPAGQYNLIRSHNLRKYFNNAMRNKAKAPVDFVDYLCGRKETTTREAYHEWDPELLKAEYMKYMEYVSIDPIHVKTIETEDYKHLKAQNEELMRLLTLEREERQNMGAFMEESERRTRMETNVLSDSLAEVNTELRILKEIMRIR